MGKNYLTYPCRTMNITQGYSDNFSHYPHTVGSVRDYPWDEACENKSRSAMHCPCDEIKIKRIYGVGSGGTNTLWLESTSRVLFADGTEDYFTMLVTHPDDSDIKNLYVGQKFRRGDAICHEGTDGNATGNHFHFSAGKGRNGSWALNSRNKWVLTCDGKAAKPEELFYIDKSFTTVKSSCGLKFRDLPSDTAKRKYSIGNYMVTKALLLHVRKGPGTSYGKKKFSQLTQSAQRKITALAHYKANGYVMGLTFTVYETRGDWGRTPSGWVHLGYCKKSEAK